MNSERFAVLTKYSNIPPGTYETHRLEKFFNLPGAKKAYQAALEFISGKTRHYFITFVGEPGRGKTHLAIGIGWFWLINEMGLVKYWQVESLLDDLRQGFSAKNDEEFYSFGSKMKQVKGVPLLILDDLGVEQSTPWARSKLDEIVDHRYINGAKTVFTTNLHPDSLELRVASRLREGIVVVLECGDFRAVKARQTKNEEVK